jgi:hypothetical protein
MSLNWLRCFGGLRERRRAGLDVTRADVANRDSLYPPAARIAEPPGHRGRWLDLNERRSLGGVDEDPGRFEAGREVQARGLVIQIDPRDDDQHRLPVRGRIEHMTNFKRLVVQVDFD